MSRKNSEKVYSPACLLRRVPKNYPNCEATGCWRCGWNEQEERQRVMLLAVNGLTMCSDGLRRLVMPARNDVKEETK